MPTTTATDRRVARHAGLVKDAFRASRSRKVVAQTDPYVAQLAKEILSRESDPRRRGIEQVMTLVADLARRVSLEDAESVGYLMIAVARHERRLAHPAEGSVVMSRKEAHIAEEHAEGIAEEAETIASEYPTVSNFLKYLVARAAHLRAIEQFDATVRAEVVGQNAEVAV